MRNIKEKPLGVLLAVALLVVASIQMGGTFVSAAASSTVDINELLKEEENAQTSGTEASGANNDTTNESAVTDNSEELTGDAASDAFIDSLIDSMDMTQPEDPKVKAFGEKVTTITSWVVQGLVYIMTAGLTISKLIDIIYLIIPPARTALANGYMGNAAAAGMPNSAMGGGMGPMGGMGGMGGMYGGGMGGMGGYGGMGGGMYGRGRYGMGGMGMGGMMGSGMAGGMPGQEQMAMQNQPMRGRIQWVSNAALNAVATESVLGPDGKGQSAFKTYIKDAVVSLLAAPALIILCATGSIAGVGLGIGKLMANILQGIKF